MNNQDSFFKQNNNDIKIPLYPEEAYSMQNNQNINNENKTEGNNISQNALLPLLLSALQGGENMDMMKLLSSMNSNSNNSFNPQLIETLTKSLNKNKKKETPSTKVVSLEKPFPKNEFFY